MMKEETFFFNGEIYTFSEKYGVADSMVVKNGVIVAVGRKSELLRDFRAENSVDLEGKTVIPSFIDSHTHFVKYSLTLGSLDLNFVESRAEVLRRVGETAVKVGKGNWIFGFGWDESIWQEKTYLTMKELDSVAPDNPVVLVRVDGHLCSVNSMAFEAAEIPMDLPGVERNGKGEPTGVLREESVKYILKEMKIPVKEKKKWLVEGVKKAHSMGVTMIHDNVYPEDVKAYLELKREGKLKIRVYFLLQREFLDQLEKTGLSTGFGDEWLRIGALKIFLDGSLGAKTAAVSTGYIDNPGNKGVLLMRDKEYLEILEHAKELKMQLAIHALGDKAIEFAVNGIKRIYSRGEVKKLRHRFEHLELINDHQIDEMREMGIVASTQPNFIGRWGHPGELYEHRLGARWLPRLNPYRKIYQKKVEMAFGSDCMPFNPFFGLESTINAPYPDQRLSPWEAIKCYTYGGAFASFNEKLMGTLEPNKTADFVVLSFNPFLFPTKIKQLKVVKTFISGEQVI